MKTRSIFAVVVAVLLALLAVLPTSAQSQNAMVRVVHASPDAPAVDVYVNGNVTLEDVPFFTVSDYLSLPAGDYRFQITPAGEPVDAAVIDASATLAAGSAYTVAATGEVANITATVIEDDLSAPAAGEAKVRVYHFSPDAPAVDVKLADGTALIENLAFPDASDYLSVPAETYDLQVTPAGDSAVVIDLPDTALAAGNIYSVFATDVVASITPELSVYTPAAAGSGSSDAPSTLPSTGSGTDTQLGLLIAISLMLVAGGLFVARRRTI
jgi:LPXTG-motif cell wall-anchored protein